MKKFQFSLDHVRDYRDRLLDEETGKLQCLQAERDRLDDLIEAGRRFDNVTIQ